MFKYGSFSIPLRRNSKVKILIFTRQMINFIMNQIKKYKKRELLILQGYNYSRCSQRAVLITEQVCQFSYLKLYCRLPQTISSYNFIFLQLGNIFIILQEFSIMQNSESPEPTEQMKTYFQLRTREHIFRVIKNMMIMEGYYGLSIQTLQERGSIHDKSKLSPPQLQGYIWLTWFYRCQKNGIGFKYPQGIKEVVKIAIHHHLKNNLHHPQSHTNPNEMDKCDIVQMVCDWTAMSQQYHEKSCLGYVQKNIDKHGFSNQKKNQIFQCIAEIDKRIEQSKKTLD